MREAFFELCRRGERASVEVARGRYERFERFRLGGCLSLSRAVEQSTLCMMVFVCLALEATTPSSAFLFRGFLRRRLSRTGRLSLLVLLLLERRVVSVRRRRLG